MRLQIGLARYVEIGMSTEMVLEQGHGHHQWDVAKAVLLDQLLQFLLFRAAQGALQVARQMLQHITMTAAGRFNALIS